MKSTSLLHCKICRVHCITGPAAPARRGFSVAAKRTLSKPPYLQIHSSAELLLCLSEVYSIFLGRCACDQDVRFRNEIAGRVIETGDLFCPRNNTNKTYCQSGICAVCIELLRPKQSLICRSKLEGGPKPCCFISPKETRLWGLLVA